MARFEVVILPTITIGYIEANGGVKNASEAHEELGSLLVKKNVSVTFGLHYVEADKYIAGVPLRGRTTKLNLPQTKIPKGLYAEGILNNWAKRVDKIGAGFNHLKAAVVAEGREIDAERPLVEVYFHPLYAYGSNELKMRLPILKPRR